MAFRPSSKDILELVEAYLKIEVIRLPRSYRRTVSKSIKMFLEVHRIQLIEREVGGHRKEISKDIRLDPGMITYKMIK